MEHEEPGPPIEPRRALPAPPTLVVIGAALGAGRWLSEHVLTGARWGRVYLVDSDRSRTSLRDIPWSFDAPTAFGRSEDGADGIRFVVDRTGPDAEPLTIEGAEVVLVLAVPPSALDRVIRAASALRLPVSAVLVSAAGMVPALASARRAFGPAAPSDTAAPSNTAAPIVGVHALNDASAANAFGQTIYLAPVAGATVPPWLRDAVAGRGATALDGTPEEHDRTMSVVQALTHRVLIAFAEAVERSGLDIEHDLWRARTPLFETLLGLSARVLDTRQQMTLAVIQEALASPAHLDHLDEALRRLPAHHPQAPEVVDWIQTVRAEFTGSFFDSLRSIAAGTVTAAQEKRTALAGHRALGSLVGLRGHPHHRLHVGTVVDLSSTTVTVEELLVGERGSAVLLHGAGIANAKRLGVPPKRRRTTFSLGHVALLSDVELNEVLDRNLARISRDVRFLVPESVSGAGVLRAADEMGLVFDAELVDEVVRTGQRSVVLRFGIRADQSVEAVTESVREHVASVYSWPRGLTRTVRADPGRRIVYLGPAGTFSEVAAAQLAGTLGAGTRVEDVDAFDDVVAAVTAGDIGVLPLSSSSSGLVTRTVRVLLGADARLVAGGVIDVAVRFDAYRRPGVTAESLRGGVAYSHPQALAQCGAFIQRWRLRPVETASTAASLERVARDDGPSIALAGVGKGAEYGLDVFEREIDDISGSITRFLIVGADDVFGPLEGGSAPTLRSVWVGDDVRPLLAGLAGGGAGFDEILTDADGRFALISSRDADAVATPPGARYLGSVPWSPRTPIVRPRV